MKNYLRVLGVIVLIVGGLAVAQNFIARAVVIAAVEQMTGAKAAIGGFYISLLRQKVSIRDFRLFNPRGFPKTVMVDIPEITVVLDVPALFKQKLHLPLVSVNLKEAVVIKDRDGKLNVDSLKFAQEQGKGTAAQKNMPFQIDVLQLTLGQVVVKEYHQSREPRVMVYPLGVANKQFKNITTPEQMASVILVQAMGPTALKSAAVYGIATVVGMGILPVGVAGVLVGKDEAAAEFRQGPDVVFAKLSEIIRAGGENVVENRAALTIKANIEGCQVQAQVERSGSGMTTVTVAARRLLIPRPEIAGGIVYQLREKLRGP